MAKYGMTLRMRRWIHGLLALATLIACPAHLSAADISYGYDEAGRLVQVQTPTGSAHYRYDVAGNLIAVQRPSAGTVAIAEFSPNAGPTGTQVTITGSGFSVTPAANVVRFNGTTASVISASSSSLTVVLPAGATTGAISVTVAASTATSAESFVVTVATPNASPVITSMSASLAGVGDTVTLTGSGFVGTGSAIWVRVNGVNAPLLSVTSTQITFTVPTGATSGLVTVGTRNGSSIGATTLLVPPAGSTVAQIGATGNIAVDGSQQTMAVPTTRKGLFAFAGTMGNRIGLGVSALTTTPSGQGVTIHVYRPDGVQLTTCLMSAAPGGSCNLPVLTASGTYTVLVTPNTGAAATFGMTLSNDLAGTLVSNGAAQTFATARVGQNARYTFSGVAGQNMSVMWSGATFAGIWSFLHVYQPDGTQLSNAAFSADTGYERVSGSLDLVNLPTTGTYTVFVDPFGTSTGQVAVAVASLTNPSVALTVDGASMPIALAVGQNGDYTFTGTTGQRLGLGVSALSTAPTGGTVSIQVLRPDGAVLTYCSSFTAAGGNCNLEALPVSGQYTLRVDPQGAVAANLTLTLSNDLAGTIVPNGSALTFATPRVGQNARYTFSGTAGQNMSVLWSGVTFPGTWSYLRVYRPDGTEWSNAYFSGDTDQGRVSGTLDLANLPVTGTYTVFIDPVGESLGRVELALLANASVALAVDGAPTPATLAAGQDGDYPFTGSTGQRLSLGVSAVSTSPPGGTVNIQLLRPDGTLLWTCPSFTSTGSCNLPALPVSGQYILRVNPQGTAAANLTLTLSNDVAGDLVPNGAALTFATARVGQNARYTFNGTAGQNMSLLWSGATFPGAWTRLYVYRPNGTELTRADFTSETTYPGYSSGTIDLINLSVTGSYTVFIAPAGASTGQVTVSLLANPSVTLAVDGTPTQATLAAGQNGDYSFTGTAGQRLGLGISALSTTPTAGLVNIQVLRNDGTLLTDCLNFTSAGGKCKLAALPVSGQYTVRVNPLSTVAANLTLTLSNDMAGSIVPNGTALTFATSRVGQNGRYTVNGTAGQNLTLLWSGATFAGGLYVYRPDGSSLINTGFNSAPAYSSGSLDLVNLPVTGAYTVLVDPGGTSTGQVNMSLLSNASATLAIDGTPTSVALTAGQNGDYVFNGTAGQRLGLGISSLSTTPGAGSVRIDVFRPDRTLLTSCSGFSSGGGNCNLEALPVAGQYTVRVNPQGMVAANLVLTLSNDVAGTLLPNGAAFTFATTRVGQNARYSLSGTAGQNLSLRWSGTTFPGTWSRLNVYGPDGWLLSGTNITGDPASAYGSGTLDLVNLPTTGTYTVFVDPFDTSTGQVTVSLLSYASATLVVDGAPTLVTLAAGQKGDYAFSGTVGQRLGLGISEQSTTPSAQSVAIQVLRPNGTVLVDCFSFGSEGQNCNLPALPVVGQYTVRVNPSLDNSWQLPAANLTLTLSNDVAGTLVANGAPLTFATSRVGQNARYILNGTAGQNLSLLWSGATFPGSYSNLVVYRPDGTQLSDARFSGDLVIPSDANGTLTLTNLPTSGTYTVFVDPFGASTGQVQLSLTGPPGSGGGGGEEGDVPLPLWSLLVLGAALLGRGHWSSRRRH